jgi:hypothetical protein
MYLKDLLANQTHIEEILNAHARQSKIAMEGINAWSLPMSSLAQSIENTYSWNSTLLRFLNENSWDTLRKSTTFTVPSVLAHAITTVADPSLRESFTLQANMAFQAFETMNQVAKSMTVSAQFVQKTDILAMSYSSFIAKLADLDVRTNSALALSRFATSVVDLQGVWLTNVYESAESEEPLDVDDLRLNTLDVLIEDVRSSELSNQELSDEEVYKVLERTNSFRLQELAIEIASLRYDINIDAETSTGRPIFKATTKTEFYASQFGVVITVDRATFESYAQRLYEYLYESSSEWKRVTAFIFDFPRVAERVKHLRRQAVHDTEHGSPSDIRSKALQVGSHFQELIGHRVPQDRYDWQLAQIRLLEEIVQFLKDLSHAVKEPPQ